MKVIALEYHDVVHGDDLDASGFPGSGPASYKLDLASWRLHLDSIDRRIASEPIMADDLSRIGTTREKRLLLTFDDGGVSALSDVADSLEERGWYGHFFVTSERIGTPGFLDKSQIRELRERRHVIGAHSHTHPARFGALSVAQMMEEWTTSTGILEDILGEPVTTASVPGGFYRPQVAATAVRTNIRYLFTSRPTAKCWHVGDCMVIGRYTIRRWTPADTAAGLAAGRWLPRFRQYALYSSLDLLRGLLGDHYSRFRKMFWARIET